MIDARGLACPQPVVMVQKAVKQDAPATLEVLVDNRTAVENVTRFGGSQGYQATVENLDGGEFRLTLTK